MAKLLVSAVVVGLLISGAAFAQPPDDHHGGGHGPAPAHGGPPPGPAHAAPQHAGPAPQAQRGGPPNHRQAVDHRPSAGQQAAPHAQPAPRAAMRGAPAGSRPAMAMHGPAMGAPNHNFASFQRNVTAQRRFHASSYHRPRGWYSHRWTFGETLPALFWTQNYWISDYVDYDLPPPPPGTVWVRDGSDALLIAQDDGEIIQVDYGVFY